MRRRPERTKCNRGIARSAHSYFQPKRASRPSSSSVPPADDERKHRRLSGGAPASRGEPHLSGAERLDGFRGRLCGIRDPKSDTARKSVAARSRALEARIRSPCPARQTATDRVLGDRPLKALFDATLQVGHRQGTISASQDTYDGPLDHTIAEPLGLGQGRHRPSPAHARTVGNPFQDRLQGSIVV
jgi:hypothetical protein